MYLIDLLFIDIPEFIVIFLLISILVNNKFKTNQLICSTVVYSIITIIKYTTGTSLGSTIQGLTICMSIYLMTNIRFVNICIATITSLVIRFMLDVIALIIINNMGIKLEVILNNKLYKIIVCHICLITLYGIYIIIKKYKEKHQVEINKKIKNISLYINKNIESIIVSSSILVLLVITIILLDLENNKDKNLGSSNLIAIYLFFSLIILIIGLILTIINHNKQKILSKLENNLMQTNLNQMKETVDLLRIQKHDYMNHLQVILMQVTNGKNEDAKNYILSIANENSNSIIYFNTGNSYIDAVLNTKKRRASKYNIELTACIDSLLEKIELSDSELTSILLNIVDNSIDELKKFNRDYKYIHVDTYKEDDFYNISIKNNGSKIEDINKIFELGYSSKGKDRGYGLYHIKKILESYNCTLDIYSDEIETEFIIKIPEIKNIVI